MKSIYHAILLLIASLLLIHCGESGPKAPSLEPLKNGSVAPYQTELLDVAFESVTKMPVEPHIKDRSRVQGEVITAALILDQPVWALEHIPQIDNWRQGEAFSNLAFYCAQNGMPLRADTYIQKAKSFIEQAEDWRRDRIKTRVAQTYILLGKPEEAQALNQGLVDSETGKVESTQAKSTTEKSFDERVKQFDALIATGNFDIVRNGLMAYARLYGEFYSDPDKRSMIEQKIKSAWGKIPYNIRIEMLSILAEGALKHDDKAQALSFVDEAKEFLDSDRWRPEHKVKLMAIVIKLRHRAGATDQALEEAQTMEKYYQDERERIINIYRAGALRPLAEAYHTIGQPAKALEIYRMAVDAGVENPNARPQAEDLASTCASIARQGLEPNAVLWKRIQEVNEGLKAPW